MFTIQDARYRAGKCRQRARLKWKSTVPDQTNNQIDNERERGRGRDGQNDWCNFDHWLHTETCRTFHYVCTTAAFAAHTTLYFCAALTRKCNEVVVVFKRMTRALASYVCVSGPINNVQVAADPLIYSHATLYTHARKSHCISMHRLKIRKNVSADR